MNKVFKIIWNKTTQSFVVTSELAKGAVKASSNSEQRVASETRLSSLFKLSAFALSLSAVIMPAQAKVIVGDGSNAPTPTNVNDSSIAIGNAATSASARNTTAIGNDVNGRYVYSVLIGDGTGKHGATNGDRNILIGRQSQVGDSSSTRLINQSIAIGSGSDEATDSPKFGGSITQGAWARGDQSIAIGGNVVAYGNSSMSLGGDDLDAVGGVFYTDNHKFILYDDKGIKTGEYNLKGKSLRDIYKQMTGDTMNNRVYENTIAGEGSVALGVQANSSAALSLAIGTKSKATVFGATALGTGAKATKLNSVALGTASVISKAGQAYVERTILGTTYTWAGGAQVDEGDVVSIGDKGYERQIINLAPGDISANSTDAINGSQLYAAMAEIEKIRYFSVKSNVTGNQNNTGATGENSIAIGPNASTASTSARSIVVGNDAFSSHADSVSLGNGAQTKNNNSTAIGTLAKTEGANSIAVGLNASTTHTDSIAMGSNATAAENKLVAIGPDAKSTARYGVSLGNNASAAGDASIAIGNSTNASHDNAIAIGDAANTNSWATIAIGNNASAAASRTIAVGRNASAAGQTAIAMGIDSNASEYSAIAIGELATSNGGYSVAMGHKANVGGGLSVGIGVSSNASANWTTAIGSSANASANYATALGTDSTASGGFSIASGYASKASGGNSMALGTNSNASNETTIAIGVNSLASGINTIALGQGSKATDYSAMAFGLGANSSGKYSIAIGQDTKAAIERSIAIGNEANASQAFAISQGAFSAAAGRESLALGYWANATQRRAVAIGRYAEAIAQDAVALGADSQANVNMFDNTTGYAEFKDDAGASKKIDFAAKKSLINGAVSVGKAGNERQIHNVAAGRLSPTSTDAVNGSQLYTVLHNSGFNVQENGTSKSRINNNGFVNFVNGTLTTANVTDNGNGSNVTFNVNTTTIKTGEDGNATAANPNNLATAGDVTAAINKVRNMPLTFAGDTGTNVTRKLGETVKVVGGVTDAAKLSDGNIGVVANGQDKLEIKLAKDINVDSVKAGDTVLNKDGVKVGDTVLNKDGLKAGDTTINNDGLTIAGGPSVTKNGINAGNNKITGVAAGEADTDAVNVSQLKDVAKVANKGWNLTANGTNSSNVAPGETVDLNNDDGNIVITKNATDDNVTFNLNKTINVTNVNAAGNVTVGDTVLNTDGLSIKDGPSVKKDGINAGNKSITNVANGTAPTDAVNVSQLNAAKTEVKAGKNTSVTPEKGANGQTIYKIDAVDTSANVTTTDALTVENKGAKDVGDASVTNYHLDLSQKTKDDIKQGVDANTTVNTKGLTFNGDSGSTNVEKLGSTVTIKGDDNITTEASGDQVTVKLNKNITVTTVNTTTINLGEGDNSTPITVVSGKDAAPNLDGKTPNRMNFGGETVATLSDGLKFGANVGDVYGARLNSQINVKGADSNTNWSEFDGGDNVMTNIDKSGNIRVGIKKNLKVESVTANKFTAGDTVIDSNGVTIKNGPSMTKNGIDAGNKQITNVAPGRIAADSTDAVNGSQLHEVKADMNNKINKLNDQVNKLGKRVNAGTASALAASQLPQAYIPGKSMVSVAAGNYQGQNAVALGMSRISDNGKIIIRLAGTSDTQGKVGVAVGAGYHW